MTIKEVIDRVETQRTGRNISLEEYISWLNILEEDIFTNVISLHKDNASYDIHTTEDDSLLVPDMYADLYSFWLFARIDLANGDIGSYTNNMILYNNLIGEFSRYYTRTYMPKTKARIGWR